MRLAAALALSAAIVTPAAGQQVVSEYTDLDWSKNCAVFAQAEDGEGDWANLVCAGWRGYPVLVFYGDARESVFYGFAPDGELQPTWESFSAFNEVGPKIEWRIERNGDVATPFATIHRWHVQADPNGDGTIEVLVIEKVGQVHARVGCAVGYVVATGNPNANDTARRIADDIARDFTCGDQPVIDAGNVPVPDFTRFE